MSLSSLVWIIINWKQSVDRMHMNINQFHVRSKEEAKLLNKLTCGRWFA